MVRGLREQIREYQSSGGKGVDGFEDDLGHDWDWDTSKRCTDAGAGIVGPFLGGVFAVSFEAYQASTMTTREWERCTSKKRPDMTLLTEGSWYFQDRIQPGEQVGTCVERLLFQSDSIARITRLKLP